MLSLMERIRAAVAARLAAARAIIDAGISVTVIVAPAPAPTPEPEPAPAEPAPEATS